MVAGREREREIGEIKCLILDDDMDGWMDGWMYVCMYVRE